jgi:hypothetical protein
LIAHDYELHVLRLGSIPQSRHHLDDCALKETVGKGFVVRTGAVPLVFQVATFLGLVLLLRCGGQPSGGPPVQSLLTKTDRVIESRGRSSCCSLRRDPCPYATGTRDVPTISLAAPVHPEIVSKRFLGLL